MNFKLLVIENNLELFQLKFPSLKRFVILFKCCFSIQSQCKEFGLVYEKSVRRLETLEIDQKRSCDEIDRLRREIQSVSKEKSMLEEEIAFLKRRRPSNDDDNIRRRPTNEDDIRRRPSNEDDIRRRPSNDGIRRRRSVVDESRSEKKYSDDRIRSQAIIIEKNGHLSSPFLN